jgi:hypothetical protein
MKFTQLKSTPTAENLNNRVAQMFGSKIKLESFTVEQLTAARDKLANQLQVIENQANFDAIHTSEAYQKNRLFLKVIEQKIAELQITPSDDTAAEETVLDTTVQTVQTVQTKQTKQTAQTVLLCSPKSGFYFRPPQKISRVKMTQKRRTTIGNDDLVRLTLIQL